MVSSVGAPIARSAGSLLPSVRARMRRRFIVNWRVDPAALDACLPAPWLRAQVINDYAVVSFCILELERLTLGPLPPIVGPSSTSCALRFAVVDTRAGANEPAVFVPERQTDSRWGARFTRLGFSAPHRYVDADVEPASPGSTIDVTSGSAVLFRATLTGQQQLGSEVFDDVGGFARFIASGVRSYGFSRHDGKLTVLDLHKDDARYDPQRHRHERRDRRLLGSPRGRARQCAADDRRPLHVEVPRPGLLWRRWSLSSP